jgi:hypothetical protein
MLLCIGAGGGAGAGRIWDLWWDRWQVGTEVGQVTEVVLVLTHRMLWLALHRVSRPHRT